MVQKEAELLGPQPLLSAAWVGQQAGAWLALGGGPYWQAACEALVFWDYSPPHPTPLPPTLP